MSKEINARLEELGFKGTDKLILNPQLPAFAVTQAVFGLQEGKIVIIRRDSQNIPVSVSVH